MPALTALMLISALLVPLTLASEADNAAYSESVTGTWFAGGDTGSRSNGGGGRTSYCEDAPVEFSTGVTLYRETALIDGTECLTEGSREIEIRYKPDDPRDFSTVGRQETEYSIVVWLAVLGCLVSFGAIVRRLVMRVVVRRRAG